LSWFRPKRVTTELELDVIVRVEVQAKDALASASGNFRRWQMHFSDLVDHLDGRVEILDCLVGVVDIPFHRKVRSFELVATTQAALP
jgi:hypothetical protein